VPAGLDPFLNLLVVHEILRIKPVPIRDLVLTSLPAFIGCLQRWAKGVLLAEAGLVSISVGMTDFVAEERSDPNRWAFVPMVTRFSTKSLAFTRV
jgi:hypothetical protein